ncbi:Deoxynucleotidyltransferase terminal-interacting protein 1, partial [Caligus rogercresseyi]
QNERIWTKRGLLLTDPIEKGLRVIEISILTEPALNPPNSTNTPSLESLPASPIALHRLQSASTSSADPLELLRIILQKELNAKIESLFSDYIRLYLLPAAKNVETNLGGVNASELLERTCINALEHAKTLFKGSFSRKRGSQSTDPSSSKEPTIKKIKNERRGFEPECLFVLSGQAGTAILGGSSSGKAFLSKHPQIFKYAADQEDKEWLMKERLISTSGGKATLVVLRDVLALYSSSSSLEEKESSLRGFKLPDFMLEKDDGTVSPSSSEVAELLLHEMKAAPSAPGEEDDLGFLTGMNLHSLVREFEMEAGAGSQHLGILSLADDSESFSELSNEVVQESFDSIELIDDERTHAPFLHLF